MTEKFPSDEPPKKRGRPKKIFSDSSFRTKERNVAFLMENYSLEELEYAVERLKKKKSIDKINICPSKALTLYMDLDLSERKYKVLRSTMNSIIPDCLPSLYMLQMEKKKRLPTITVSEVSAEVNLKSILRRTAEGVLSLCNVEGNTNKISLICKWGMDGSSGHSRYKQKFADEEHTDEFMFLVAFVPLR